MAMSLAYHFGESSAEKIENWPADKFNSWAQYSQAIGGMTPVFLEPLLFGLWQLTMWSAIQGEKEPIEFEDLFQHRCNREQTTEEIFAQLRRLPSVNNPQ